MATAMAEGGSRHPGVSSMSSPAPGRAREDGDHWRLPRKEKQGVSLNGRTIVSKGDMPDADHLAEIEPLRERVVAGAASAPRTMASPARPTIRA